VRVSDIGRFERRLIDDRRISRPHDQIEIRGLRVQGYHGVHGYEARDGQQFVVDLVLDMDTQIAARTDDLDDTIDYVELVSHVADMVRSTRFNLLEALGAHIAEQLLAARRVAGVRVTLTKPEVELDEDVDAVAVTVYRVRPVHVR
jgi:dihydroneopterin aldolase